MFVKVSVKKTGKKVYKYAELVKSVREERKISHKRLLYFGAVDDLTISKLKFIYDQDANIVDSNTINCENSVPYGNFLLINKIFESLKISEVFENSFFNIFDKNNKPYITVPTAVNYIKAMVMQRIIRPESKLSLVQWYKNTPICYFIPCDKLDLQTA